VSATSEIELRNNAPTISDTCPRHRSHIGNVRKREFYIDPPCTESTYLNPNVGIVYIERRLCPLAATPLFFPFSLVNF